MDIPLQSILLLYDWLCRRLLFGKDWKQEKETAFALKNISIFQKNQDKYQRSVFSVLFLNFSLKKS